MLVLLFQLCFHCCFMSHFRCSAAITELHTLIVSQVLHQLPLWSMRVRLCKVCHFHVLFECDLLYVCIYAYTLVFMYVCMYVCMYVLRIYLCMYASLYVCAYVCIYVWMHVCMFVCMYLCIYL